MNGPITIPGTVPGLLNVGAPVLRAGSGIVGDYGHCACILDAGDSSAAIAWTDGGISATGDDVPLASLALDLRAPLGPDVARAWLLAHLPGPVRVDVDTSGSWWYRIKGTCTWCLHVPGGDHAAGEGRYCIQFSADVGRKWARTHDGWAVSVPAFGVDISDPDADMLALAAVVIHVAGTLS